MIGISSYDAGGAELLSEYVLNNKNKDYIFFLGGPAKKIFKKKLKNIKISNFKKSVASLSYVISSTGWSSDYEKKIISSCRIKNLKVFALLDHWVNYKERFIYKNKLILPNEIWVADNEGYKIANKIFKKNNKIIIRKIKNYYFEKVKKKLIKKNILNELNKKILYLCEPISEHYKLKSFYNEKDCINLFVKKYKKFHNIKAVTFRPHPSESIKKYDWLSKLKFGNNKVRIQKKNDLLDDIVDHDIIVGCNTIALYYGVLAKKQVYTSMPFKYKCEIPTKKITYLRDIK